jgi:hypothetical protein
MNDELIEEEELNADELIAAWIESKAGSWFEVTNGTRNSYSSSFPTQSPDGRDDDDRAPYPSEDDDDDENFSISPSGNVITVEDAHGNYFRIDVCDPIRDDFGNILDANEFGSNPYVALQVQLDCDRHEELSVKLAGIDDNQEFFDWMAETYPALVCETIFEADSFGMETYIAHFYSCLIPVAGINWDYFAAEYLKANGEDEESDEDEDSDDE